MVIWIGIRSDSQVSYKSTTAQLSNAKGLLIDHDIKDVEIEMRKSKDIQLAGPRLLQPTDDRDRMTKVGPSPTRLSSRCALNLRPRPKVRQGSSSTKVATVIDFS